MDFIEGLPKVNGKSVILVVTDRLTKHGHFLPLAHSYTALQVARLFFYHLFKLHGLPKTIVCDRDPLFVSKFWKDLFTLQGTSFNMSSAYRPQTNGQTENLNKILAMYLRYLEEGGGGGGRDYPKKWITWLSWIEYIYNTSYH